MMLPNPTNTKKKHVIINNIITNIKKNCLVVLLIHFFISKSYTAPTQIFTHNPNYKFY